MKLKLPLTILALLVLGGAAAFYITLPSSANAQPQAGEQGTATKPPETSKGPNNGRILTDGAGYFRGRCATRISRLV